MHGSPGVRASAARDLLAFADRYAQGTRDRILGAMPEASRHHILEASRVAFLPIEHDHWVVDGLVGALGPRQAVACWRASVPDMVDKPLLRSLVSGLLRLWGDNRRKTVHVIPRAWQLVYRDLCEVRLEASDHARTVVVFEGVDAAVLAYPNYFLSWEGVCLGALDLSQAAGGMSWTVEMARRRAVATYVWSGAA